MSVACSSIEAAGIEAPSLMDRLPTGGFRGGGGGGGGDRDGGRRECKRWGVRGWGRGGGIGGDGGDGGGFYTGDAKVE